MSIFTVSVGALGSSCDGSRLGIWRQAGRLVERPFVSACILFGSPMVSACTTVFLLGDGGLCRKFLSSWTLQEEMESILPLAQRKYMLEEIQHPQKEIQIWLDGSLCRTLYASEPK